MATTIRIVLRADKVNKDGLCQIAVCVTANRKRTYFTTGVRVHPDNWTGTAITSNVDNSNLLNAKINRRRNEIEKEILTNELSTGKDTQPADIATLRHSGPKGFHEYAKEVLKNYTGGNLRRWTVEQNHLLNYRENLAFADITPVWLTLYHDYQLKTLKHASNTSISAFKWLRIVMSHAKKRGITQYYPFKEWKLPKYEQPVKPYLTYDECIRIQGVLSKDYSDEIKKVAAFFLVECFAGIRVSDWGKFRIEKLIHDNALKVGATKNGEPVYLSLRDYPILAKVIKYMADNNLNWTEPQQHARTVLKSIAIIANIQKHVTTHTGRHTCATLHLERGFSYEYIAQLLGVSLKIVGTYAKMTRQKLRVESERIGGF